MAVDEDVLGVGLQELLRRRASHFVAVTHTDPQAVALSANSFAEAWVIGRVGVAEHGVHRRNHSELVEDLVTADVTGVENQLDSRQRFVNVRPQQTVRVGNQANQDRLILPRMAPSPIA